MIFDSRISHIWVNTVDFTCKYLVTYLKIQATTLVPYNARKLNGRFRSLLPLQGTLQFLSSKISAACVLGIEYSVATTLFYALPLVSPAYSGSG